MCKTLKQEQRGLTLAQPETYYSPSMMLRSVMQTGYVNSYMLGKDVKSKEALMDAFRDAFNAFSNEDDATQMASRDVERMVLLALGDHQPQYILDKFSVLLKDSATNRLVSWENVEAIVPTAAAIITEECKPKREVPYVMGGKVALDKGLGTGEKLSTNYRDNFREGHQFTPFEPGMTRADVHKKKTLLHGTAKATGHIPGYLGHIPLNTLNPHKEKHSKGVAHPIQNDLMLTRKGTLQSMGNYSGHIPQYSVMKNERMTGCDPLSTMGGSFAGKRYLL